jgi:galactokinase
MSNNESVLKRLHGKEAKERLASIYGKAAVAGQIHRYEALLERIADSRLETEPRFYSAPGRTELGGNHTDHNRGRVLCAAVDLDAVACASPTGNSSVRIVSEGWTDPIVVDLAELEPRPAERGKTEALVRGVARGLANQGVRAQGFEARIHSTVLPGSGLSSSAAIEVLLGTIMADLSGSKVAPVDIARIGQFAENRFFGKPCGLMDQTASAVGGIVAIDFANPEKPRLERLEFDFERAGYSLAVVNTGGSHADLTADYAAIPAEMGAVARFLGAHHLREIAPADLITRGPEIRAACGDRALLRALHFAAENARVPEMVEALSGGDLKAYLKLVKKSGDSSWRLLQNLYPPETPGEQGLCLAVAVSQDFFGKKGAARVHGGGFAGTIQAYVPESLFEGWKAVMERYFGAGSVIPIKTRALGAARIL